MKLILNSRDSLLNLNLKKIVYLLADGNNTRIVLDNKLVFTCGIGLNRMEEMIGEVIKKHPGEVVLVRAGKSHIINVEKIVRIDTLKQQVSLLGEGGVLFNVKISREASRGLKQLISQSL